MSSTDTRVTDVPRRHRYEVTLDGDVVGFAAYRKTPTMVVFTHTEVGPEAEGKGVGSTLIQEALDDVRRQGLAVLPQCPFVREWLTRHPEYADLVHRRTGSPTE
jgi:uncharacterized protein